MKPTTRIAIASLLSAAGHLLTAFAGEFSDEEVATSPGTPKKTRGKAATEKPVETVATETGLTAAAEATVEEPTTTGEGKTYEELRALIAQPVKDGQGEEVKKIIKKYAGEGGSLKTLDAKHHAAFEKDIQALTY